MKNSVSKLPNGACRARVTLQKFGYSVLSHMGAFFRTRLLSKEQFTSDITTTFGYSALISMLCFLLSKMQFLI